MKEIEKINYTIRKSKRAKNIRLAVYRDGSVAVTLPHGVRNSLAEKYVEEKRDWLLKKIKFFKQFNEDALPKLDKEDYRYHKESAYRLALERVEYFNKAYGLKYNKIFIKDQKTIWGSCSAKGNLNLNYKIVFLPERLRDYIIVHELCHLKEMNHSKKYWELVAKTIPDHKEIRKRLKTSSLNFR